MSTLIPKKADKSFHVKRQGDKPAVEETANREAAQPPVVNSKQRPKGCEAAAGSWYDSILLDSTKYKKITDNQMSFSKCNQLLRETTSDNIVHICFGRLFAEE